MSAAGQKGAEVGFVTGSDFDQLLRDAPALYISALRILAGEIRAARELLVRAALARVPEAQAGSAGR